MTSLADCPADSTHCDKPQWRIIVGSQFTSCPPEVTYREKETSSPRTVDVLKNSAEKGFSPFPFAELEYRTSPISFWNLTYARDESHTAALTEETIQLLLFPIKFRIEVPGKISTQSLKLLYNRALFQNENIEFGGALGLQVLSIHAKTDRPIWGKEEYEYYAPLPALGAFASYRQSDRLTYRLKANYFSLGSFSLGSVAVGGASAEMDFTLEYQHDKNLAIGAGYRISSLKVEVDDEDYRLEGSHVAHGPQFFIVVSF